VREADKAKKEKIRKQGAVFRKQDAGGCIQTAGCRRRTGETEALRKGENRTMRQGGKNPDKGCGKEG